MTGNRFPRLQTFAFDDQETRAGRDRAGGGGPPDGPPDGFSPAYVGQLSLFATGGEPASGQPQATGSVERHASLEDLEEAARACVRCRLRQGCTQVVFGEGHRRAAVVFVGEGPGETEDQLGRPFVGRAGQLLDKILVASGFSRDEVYITNVVKCRPPGNRQPSLDETEACLPWLQAQLRLIRPRVVVCLGAAAAQVLIDRRLRITAARGKWHERDGLRLMPTFHPAALLRDMSKKRPVWDDMKKVRAEIDRPSRR